MDFWLVALRSVVFSADMIRQGPTPYSGVKTSTKIHSFNPKVFIVFYNFYISRNKCKEKLHMRCI